MIKEYFILFLSVCCLTACQKPMDIIPSNGHRFTLNVAQYEENLPKEHLRAVTNNLTQLKVGIYDNRGVLEENCVINHSPDLTQLWVTELKDGEYTAVFIGVGGRHSTDMPVLRLPLVITDTWLANPAQGAPHDNEYFYAKSHFTITQGEGMSSTIDFKRIVARVDIEPVLTNNLRASGNMTSLSVSFDDGTFYTSHNADGSYAGNSGVSEFEAIDNLNFYTLPSIGSAPRHGSLIITWTLNDNSTYKESYDFDLILKPNKRSVIRPSYTIDDDPFGTVRVYDKDRNTKNSTLFFQDPTDDIHRYQEIASHAFKMNELLQLSFTDRQMTARFYSVTAVKEVTVYAKRPSDTEFFELAWFESVGALEQRTVALSSTLDNRLYRTESGGTVFINRLGDELSYKYASEDAHMKKLSTIKWPCRVSFKQPIGADTLNVNAQDLPLRAVHAREAIALWTNVAFMYSHPQWERLLLEKEKLTPFMEGATQVSVKDTFFPKMFSDTPANAIRLNIYNVAGTAAGGIVIGNGNALGLRQLIYTEIHYINSVDPRQAYIFGPIEYAHSLGYSDNGDFAGGKSTAINKTFFQTYGNELPYPDSMLLNSKANKNLYAGLKAWS